MSLFTLIIIIVFIGYIVWLMKKNSSPKNKIKETTNSQNTQQKATKTKFCSECGAPLAENTLYCAECGTKVEM